jgi:hypothetical protein
LNPVPPEYEKGVFIMRSRFLLVDTEEKIGAEVDGEREIVKIVVGQDKIRRMLNRMRKGRRQIK